MSATSAPTPSPPPPPPSAEGSQNGTRPAPPPKGFPPGVMAVLVVGIALGAMMVLIAVGIFIIYRRKRKLPQNNHDGPFSPPPQESKVDNQQWRQNVPQLTILPTNTPPNLSLKNVRPSTESSSTSGSLGSEKPLPPLGSPGMVLGSSQSSFTYEELASATNGFSDANLIGQGGFGYVHKGVLPNGKVVAIKQLKAGSGQGEREFCAEVEIISRVHHRHLVSLVGYCITGERRMLVYEFVPNNTLKFHLHGNGRAVMSWRSRMRIALGAAKGLAYLHEDCHPKIIHRDIKAANILLDESFEAKVADFGLAKFSLDTDTHVSTRVMGTFGYLAPEYACTGKLTDKSDVFSFGVVLLEMITGRRPVNRTRDESVVDWARPLLSQFTETGNLEALVDPSLEKNYDSSEMTRMIACAAACVRHSAKLRPRMSQIVRALEGNLALDNLNEGMIPGYSMTFSYHEGSDYGFTEYYEDVKKFNKMALETQKLGSNEYSGLTNESGVNPPASSTEGQPTAKEIELLKRKKETGDSGEGS
ncbi:hypothetical protein SLE2022_310820 [Rubroshorea leprosula]